MIFMDLNKTYGALDRDICLEILERYGVGPQYRHILQVYWHMLWMVAHTGGYYRTAFQGFLGVMQEDPLSPTILNVVVDTVVQQWVEVAVDIAGEKDRPGW